MEHHMHSCDKEIFKPENQLPNIIFWIVHFVANKSGQQPQEILVLKCLTWKQGADSTWFYVSIRAFVLFDLPVQIWICKLFISLNAKTVLRKQLFQILLSEDIDYFKGFQTSCIFRGKLVTPNIWSNVTPNTWTLRFSIIPIPKS